MAHLILPQRKLLTPPSLISGGAFDFDVRGRPEPLRGHLHNTVTVDGAKLILENLFQAAGTFPTSLWLGLTNTNYTFSSTLASVAAGEPDPDADDTGYARQEVALTSANVTLEQLSYAYRATFGTVTFTASADWSTTVRQFFLCDAETGTTGNLFCVSGRYKSAITVTSGNTINVTYAYQIRGVNSEED